MLQITDKQCISVESCMNLSIYTLTLLGIKLTVSTMCKFKHLTNYQLNTVTQNVYEEQHVFVSILLWSQITLCTSRQTFIYLKVKTCLTMVELFAESQNKQARVEMLMTNERQDQID